MSNESEKPDAGSPPEDSGPRCGERLAAAREELEIGTAEIAKELHIGEDRVADLEHNRFDSLGAPVFAKGHLRKYAEIVGVDPNLVLGDYHELTRSAGLPPVVSDRKAPVIPKNPLPWITAGLLVALVVIAAYWYFERRPANTFSAVGEPAPEIVPESTPLEVSVPETVLQAAIEEPEPAASASEQEIPAAVTESLTEAVRPEPARRNEIRLELTFSGECWTEISDADGDRLFFDLGRTGRTLSVAGTPPISVLLGDADNVALRVNGSNYTVAAADRRGETARFTLYAP